MLLRIELCFLEEVMEGKHILLSALSIGVGVSVGLALASGQITGQWVGSGTITEEQLQNELRRQIVDGRESDVTFEKFPSFLRY